MTNNEITDKDIDQFLAVVNASEQDSSKHLEFDEDRRVILRTWQDVQACPGSGKTTLIAAKLMILADKINTLQCGICVLTHTNVACNEIRARLEDNPSGVQLTSYPNFIGTIQEFVNKFIAIPYIRSSVSSVTRIDDEACYALMDNMLPVGARSYLERKMTNVSNLKINHCNGEPIVPGFSNKSTSATYKSLISILKKRIKAGYFFYSEMYYFAKLCLQKNSEIVETINNRFQVVLIDEMQDTQGFQDDLLNEIFKNKCSRFQKFGDPDQAIYDSGSDSPNTSFNEDTNLGSIGSTHRLPEEICRKISGLSTTKIGQLQPIASRPIRKATHTFFLFNDETKSNVLNCYGKLLDELDPEGLLQSAKAVGATEGQGGFISEYWSEYDKSKSPKKPKPKCLSEAVARKWWLASLNSGDQYELLLKCILDLLRISGTVNVEEGVSRHFSKSSLILKLRLEGQFQAFRVILSEWITEGIPSEDIWVAQVEKLKSILRITENNDEINEFLTYCHDEPHEQQFRGSNNENIYTTESGREIEVGTIHSVKGETHDATLVLETKNHQFDVQALCGFIAQTETGKITGKRRIAFARLLYVASSRPRTLLCFAAHRNHVEDSQRFALEAQGWSVVFI